MMCTHGSPSPALWSFFLLRLVRDATLVVANVVTHLLLPSPLATSPSLPACTSFLCLPQDMALRVCETTLQLTIPRQLMLSQLPDADLPVTVSISVIEQNDAGKHVGLESLCSSIVHVCFVCWRCCNTCDCLVCTRYFNHMRCQDIQAGQAGLLPCHKHPGP